MIKPKLELAKVTDAQLVFTANTVFDQMTTNAALFTAAAADVTALGTEKAAYQAAFEAAETGRLVQQALTDEKTANRVVVENRLRKLVDLVNHIADGDINIIHDAGMQGTNEPAPVFMTQVQNLRVAPSLNDGELMADWDPVSKARIYKVQVCKDQGVAPVNWTDKLDSTRSKCALNHDLVSGTKVWVRVCAVGARDQGPWSDPAWKTVP